ncbi:MAG: polyprenyl synthetase family protein [Patescibacteria group bacterium]|jgi:geranylgeranyl diphosphate synthase type II
MTTSDFPSILGHYKNLVWPLIESNLKSQVDFPDYCRVNRKYSKLVDYYHQIISEYPRRQGKYLRPTLLLLTAQSMGVPLEKSLATAAAMQVSEDWILNHDDIEDNSLERRGAPTLHRQIGMELAINAGDALHLLMWKLLTDNLSHLDPILAQQLLYEFFNMINRTTFGQTVELKWTLENRNDLSLEDIFLILESKTGYYTIAGPMRLGAIIANATSDQLKDLYDFGVTLGRSFQIVDDLLDLTSDFAGQKKQQGNDIYEGKKTVMLMHLCQTVSPHDKSRLDSILNRDRQDKSPADVAWVIEKMDHYGSLDYGRQLASQFAKEAKDQFDTRLTFLSHEPYRSQLSQAIDFIIRRKH